MDTISKVERECCRALSDAIVNFIYDERLYVDGVRRYDGRGTKHPLFSVALFLNNRALGSLVGTA